MNAPVKIETTNIAYAKARRALEEATAALREHERAASPGAAQQMVEGAEMAMRTELFEAEIAGEALAPDRKAQLADAVRFARANVARATEAEAALPALRAKRDAAQRAVDAALRGLVEREADLLAERFHTASAEALEALQALEGIADWAALDLRDVALASELRALAQPYPPNTPADPQQLQRAKAAHDRELAATREAWRRWPAALASDPDAQPPSGEAM